jgi:hypothetical protein
MLCYLPVLKCHICGRTSNYSQVIDYNVYSVHPKCEENKKEVNNISRSKLGYEYEKVLHTCPICKTSNNDLSELELRNHLMNQHTKESLIDKILLDNP